MTTKSCHRQAQYLDRAIAALRAGNEGLRSALAAEREAHAETRARLATAQFINDCREREVKEIMGSDLPYAQQTRKADRNFRLYQEQREMARAASSRLAAAEECLREIANCACDCNPATAGVMRYHYDGCRCLPKNIRAKARAALAAPQEERK